MKKSKSILYSSLISSIVFLLFGLILFFNPEVTISSISYILGGILIIIGFINFLKYVLNNDKVIKSFDFNLVYGIVGMIAGVVLVLNPTAIATIIPLIIGVIVVVSSAIKINYSLLLKQMNNIKWKPAFIVSLLSLICGIVLILNPFKGAVVITKAIGLLIITYAILEIIEFIILLKSLKNVEIEEKNEKNWLFLQKTIVKIIKLLYNLKCLMKRHLMPEWRNR